MSLSAERLKILEMIDQGVISAEEGYSLLQALDEGDSTPIDDAEADANASAVVESNDIVADQERGRQPDPEDIQKWRRWWFIPVWIGAGITTIGGGLMYWAWRASGYGFWFACSWLPFLFGVMILALGWGSRRAPWLHVRVRQKPGENPEKIAVSLPIPIRLTAWFLRNFGHYIPNIDASTLDEVILALGNTTDQKTPFFVDVNKGDDGEKVQVFIG